MNNTIRQSIRYATSKMVQGGVILQKEEVITVLLKVPTHLFIQIKLYL